MSAAACARLPAMGTTVEVVSDAAIPRRALDRVRDLFAARESALSRFLPDSELSRLNRRAGRPTPVSGLMLEAVERAVAGARATGGAFDPGLGAWLAAHGYDRTLARLRGGATAGTAPGPAPGDWRRVRIDRARSVVTLPPGMSLDLGGIAKGMAVDAAARALRAEGVRAALVGAGGDLAVVGRPGGRHGWTVAVRGPGAAERRLSLGAGAIATSGVARRRWRAGGRERHHLIDPRTGEPARDGLWSVSVVAPTCERAEVAATAAFVLGRRRGGALLRAQGLAALMLPVGGPPVALGGWPA